ncbi:hypothetical protein WN944_015800 [Citrus x changshan-huyou]|uniref:Uncharacterized protein n=1 Tax=Citrus x changshan-huyou TaxID=2935761 RepID=A0AAP0QRE7_9ROSI
MPNYEPFNKSKALVVGLGYAQSIDDFKKPIGRSSSTELSSLVFPLCSLKDSDFILSVLDGKFVLFDPSDGTIKDFVIKGFQENLKDFSMQVYAETLISPNSKTNFLSEGALEFESTEEAVQYKLGKMRETYE